MPHVYISAREAFEDISNDEIIKEMKKRGIEWISNDALRAECVNRGIIPDEDSYIDVEQIAIQMHDEFRGKDVPEIVRDFIYRASGKVI
jgi:hypothetical protein